ncbi:MAG: LOG family protein [Anaerolineales bacterium]
MPERILTVFGGSAPQAGSEAYVQAERLGSLAARAGWGVATGGYIGTMEAVSKGASEAGGHAIGVTCDQIEHWRAIAPNQWVGEEIRRATLRERLYKLVELGDAYIALPGGIGTLSEVALSWSLIQTREIGPRPLVLVGDTWTSTLELFLERAEGYVRPLDRELIQFAPDVDNAWRQVLRTVDRAGGT